MKSLIALFFLVVVVSAAKYEQRPELGKYQDESKCFPYEEYWYVVYRTHDHDEYLGDSKCSHLKQTKPLVNGTAEFAHNGHGRDYQHLHVELHHSEGYTVHNKLNVTLLDGPKKGHNIHLYSAFSDCYECKVLRHPYAGENACSLLVPVHKKYHVPESCKFVFHLLCGEKYHTVLDETCHHHH
ncbi:uncharacterized protein LOC144153140 [Haemaphysalis longicornis]